MRFAQYAQYVVQIAHGDGKRSNNCLNIETDSRQLSKHPITHELSDRQFYVLSQRDFLESLSKNQINTKSQCPS